MGDADLMFSAPLVESTETLDRGRLACCRDLFTIIRLVESTETGHGRVRGGTLSTSLSFGSWRALKHARGFVLPARAAFTIIRLVECTDTLPSDDRTER